MGRVRDGHGRRIAGRLRDRAERHKMPPDVTPGLVTGRQPPVAQKHPPGAPPTVGDCRTDEGVIVGLIDGMIAQARVVARYLRTSPVTPPVAVAEALADIRADEDVARVLDHERPKWATSGDTTVPTYPRAGWGN